MEGVVLFLIPDIVLLILAFFMNLSMYFKAAAH